MNYEKCYNCGADYGLHQSETERSPAGGVEETRDGKKQEWSETTFLDANVRKVELAAPALLKALIEAKKIIRIWHGMGMPEQAERNMWIIYEGQSPEMKRINDAIKQATT